MTEQQIEQIVTAKVAAEISKIRRKRTVWTVILVAILPISIWAITKPYTFNDGDTLSASKLNENFDALYAQINSNKITCPTGFTSLEAQGRQIGCLQNDVRGTNTCPNAILDCFDTYGGRLPSLSEIHIGFSRYVLLNETASYQWIDTGFYRTAPTATGACGAITPSLPDSDAASTLNNYRCFIPR